MNQPTYYTMTINGQIFTVSRRCLNRDIDALGRGFNNRASKTALVNIHRPRKKIEEIEEEIKLCKRLLKEIRSLED